MEYGINIFSFLNSDFRKCPKKWLMGFFCSWLYIEKSNDELSPPPKYSSPVEYQYYLVVTLKWKITQGVPLSHLPSDPQQPPPPPLIKGKKVKTNPRIPGETDRKKKKKKKGTIFVNLPSEDSLVDEPS